MRKPASRGQGRRFEPRAYALLCLTLAALTRSPGQLLLDELVAQVRSAVADAGLDVDLDKVADRRAMAAALAVLIELGVLVERDGDLARWVEDTDAQSLLDVRRDRLTLLTTSGLSGATGPEDLLDAAALPSAAGGARVAIRRALLESPLLSVSDLTEDQAEWWRRNRNRETEWFREHIGLELELRAEGAMAIDPDESLTDLAFPGTGSARHAALLVLERLVDQVREDARSAEPGDRIWRPLPDGAFEQAVQSVRDEHGRGLRKAYSDSEVLGEDVLEVLTGSGLVRRTDEGLAVHAGSGALRTSDHLRRAALLMARDPHRFRLHRAGILNVWQYDEQVFEFCDGRLLLRGTNGAGKSKTMEMLLPFVLDGDKARMTATGRQGSQLLWLMSEGASTGGTRTGYLWVEFVRVDADGLQHVVTCGIGIRHSTSARQVTTWQFTVPTAVPALGEPDGTPLSAPRCRELVESLSGRTFESPRDYKQHVGQLLFGLEPQAYDDLLRLLYWLRQPQVGEDIDPGRLVAMLDESLPALDEDDVRQVGEALDELAEHGERLDRLRAAAVAVAGSAAVYARYAATMLRERAADALAADRERVVRTRAVSQQEAAVGRVAEELAAAEAAENESREAVARAASKVQALEAGPLARNQQVLQEKQRRAEELADAARVAAASAVRASERVDDSTARVSRGTDELTDLGAHLAAGTSETAGLLRVCAPDSTLPTAIEGLPQAVALGVELPAARQAVSTARAAVTVVREATHLVEQVTARRDAAAQRAAEAESREEQAAGRLADTEREADSLVSSWTVSAREWVAERPDLPVAIPVPVDGLSIAWAVAEYLHNSPEHAAKTLFATHYHELTELAERLPGAQNYQITATEREGEVVFLHRLERGRASKSYGIEVARLAGLPPVVLANAREVLERLERYELEVFAEEESQLEAPLSAKAAAADSALEKAASRAGVGKLPHKPHCLI